ncbi:unnamed protein product [Amoebophrya sp. A25]|nr:unnamed protein product [Amoebophrya sp. A25]|eukprot:GSA25T00018681001.1
MLQLKRGICAVADVEESYRGSRFVSNNAQQWHCWIIVPSLDYVTHLRDLLKGVVWSHIISHAY